MRLAESKMSHAERERLARLGPRSEPHLRVSIAGVSLWCVLFALAYFFAQAIRARLWGAVFILFVFGAIVGVVIAARRRPRPRKVCGRR